MSSIAVSLIVPRSSTSVDVKYERTEVHNLKCRFSLVLPEVYYRYVAKLTASLTTIDAHLTGIRISSLWGKKGTSHGISIDTIATYLPLFESTAGIVCVFIGLIRFASPCAVE